MKRKQITAGLLLMSVLLAGGCSGGGSRKQAETPLVKEGTLTVAFIDGDDGFASVENGTPVGTEPYLAGKLSEALELTLEYKQASTREELLSLLDAGQADMALGRFNEVFDGSDAYLLSRNYGKRGYYLVSQAGNYADSLAGMEGKAIAVSAEVSSESTSLIPSINEVQRSTFTDLEKAAQEVKEGTTASLICTEREAFRLLGDEQLLVKELYDSPRELYCAVFPAGAETRTATFNTVVGSYLDDVASGAVSPEGEVLREAAPGAGTEG